MATCCKSNKHLFIFAVLVVWCRPCRRKSLFKLLFFYIYMDIDMDIILLLFLALIVLANQWHKRSGLLERQTLLFISVTS